MLPVFVTRTPFAPHSRRAGWSLSALALALWGLFLASTTLPLGAAGQTCLEQAASPTLAGCGLMLTVGLRGVWRPNRMSPYTRGLRPAR